MSSAVVWLVIAPLGGAAISLIGKVLGSRRVAPALALLPLAVGVWVLISTYPAVSQGSTLGYQMGGWPIPHGILLRLDGFAWLLSGLVFLVSALVGLAALSRGRFGPDFFFFLLLLVAGMEGVVLTDDLFNMFVSFEIVAISAYVLIAFEKEPTGLVASLKYLILSSVGILFFLFGILLVYRDAGTLSLGELTVFLAAHTPVAAAPPMHLAVAALCVGVGVRTAFIPFHTWLPEAHAYAPHPVSALLSGVLIKVSFFAMIRILRVFQADYLNHLLLWIGATTALLAVIRALGQTDAKKLLAYHSISQMGYVLAAFGIARGLSTVAAFSHAVNHALFKSLLFLAVGSAVAMTGERNLYRMQPVGRRAPLLSLAFFVGALSIAGIPPFNGYASKQMISAAMEGSPAYVLIWITGVATVASFIKLSRIFFLGPSRGSPIPLAPMAAVSSSTTIRVETGPSGDARPGVPLLIATVVLAGLCVWTGLAPRFFGDLWQKLLPLAAGAAVTGGADYPELPAFFAVGKLLKTGLVVALGVGVYFAATTHPAKRLWRALNRLTPDLRTVLLFFFFGLFLFAVVAY